MQKTRCLITLLIFYGFMFSQVSAHDYWILPATFQPAEKRMLEVAFTCGHAYFEPAGTPDITKYRLFLTNPQGREIPIAYSRIDSQAAWAQVPVYGQGTYIISAVNTLPAFWSKTTEGWEPKKKSEVENAIKTGKTYKFAKTFLTAGNPSDFCKTPLGHIVEIVPQINPTVLKVNQTLPLLFLFQNKPIKNASIYGVHESFKKDEQKVETKTNKNGLAKIKLNKPGKWLISAKHEFDTPGNTDADYEYHLAYMMFEIKK